VSRPKALLEQPLLEQPISNSDPPAVRLKTTSKMKAGAAADVKAKDKVRGRVDVEKRNRSEDGSGVAAYDRSMLRLADGEEICFEEARTLSRYGMAALEGTLVFDGEGDGVHVEMEGGAEDVEMEEDGLDLQAPLRTGGREEEKERVEVGEETQPSPTFSNFAPSRHLNPKP
jgi:hypothetical protein